MRLAQKAEEELKRAALRWAAYSRDSVPEVVMMSARRELDDAAVGYHTAMNDLSNIGLITRAPKRLEELAALIRGHKFNFNDEDELSSAGSGRGSIASTNPTGSTSGTRCTGWVSRSR